MNELELMDTKTVMCARDAEPTIEPPKWVLVTKEEFFPGAAIHTYGDEDAKFRAFSAFIDTGASAPQYEALHAQAERLVKKGKDPMKDGLMEIALWLPVHAYERLVAEVREMKKAKVVS